ncbi:MAG: SpvB/TcaC N-terminal domain-containing protein [Candidatus Altimarinota bacterium]
MRKTLSGFLAFVLLLSTLGPVPAVFAQEEVSSEAETSSTETDPSAEPAPSQDPSESTSTSENPATDSVSQTEEALPPAELPVPTSQLPALNIKPKQFTLDDQEIINQNFVNLLSGSAEIRLPLQVPNGIRGLTPELNLEYSSQSVQQNGPFGFGWRMDLGEIKRLNKNGIKKMYEEPVYHINLGPLQGELILIENLNGIEQYRLRREQNFAKIAYISAEDRWEIHMTNGMSYRLGSSAQSRFQDELGSKVFSWHLDQTRDLIGHAIDYEYDRLSQVLYPARIFYGGMVGQSHPFEIEFHTITRNDYRSDYNPGFLTEMDHLVDQISIIVDGDERLRYDFTYLPSSLRSRSDLKSIQITGTNGAQVDRQTITVSYYSKDDGYSGDLYHRNGFLKSLQFPKGGTITYDYKPSTQFFNSQGDLANLRPHYPLIVVSEVTQSDFTGRSDTTHYHYSDGHFFFESVNERELAGFGRTTVTDPLNQKTVYFFHQGGGFDGSQLGEVQDHWALIGQMYRTEVYDAQGTLTQRSITRWQKDGLGSKRFFISSGSTLTTLLKTPQQQASQATSSIYDTTNGNLLESIEYGEVTGNDDGTFTDVGNDDRKTVISYADNSADYLYAFPSRQQLFDADDQLVSEQTTLYDGLSINRVRYGNPTSVMTRLLEESRDITTQTSYTSEGLPSVITDANGQTTTIAYDSFSLLPESITNPLGHVTELEYDYLFTQATHITDPNGLETMIELDGLGRAISQQMTDPNTGNQLVTMSTTSYRETSFPHRVLHQIHLDDQTSADYYQYLDGFGRVIQTRAEDDGNADQYIVSNTKYDALGRAFEVTLPVFATGTAYNLSQGSSIVTSTSYDVLDRPVSITDANGTTTMSYDRWSTTITDALGNQKTTETDAFGRLIKVIEYIGTTPHQTHYQYDPRDLLTKITDANSNVRHFFYDSLGRMTRQEDLHQPSDTDFGTRSMTYDDNGNVLTLTKADGVVISYSYDALNRPLTQTGPSVSYTYQYDQGANALGRLSSVTGPDHTWSAVYDLRGRTTSESISLSSSSNSQLQPTTYQLQATHTRFDQPSTITHPNGLVQTYTYNQVGNVKEINSSAGGIITHISYSPLNQLEALSYGNGLRSTFVYDPNQMYRMTEKRTAPAALPVTFQAPVDGRWSMVDGLSSSLLSLSSLRPLSFLRPLSSLRPFPLPFPLAHAQETPEFMFEILPVEETDATSVEITDPDFIRWHEMDLERALRGEAPRRFQNPLRDSSGGEVQKPVTTYTGPLPSRPSDKRQVAFQARYENTMQNPARAMKYQLMVEQNGNPIWDSGLIDLASPLLPGEVTPYMSFDRTLLNTDPTLETTWKLTFQLEDGLMTPWSDGQVFSSVAPAPTAPAVQELQNIRYTYDAVGNITRLEETSGTAATKTAEYGYDELYRLTSSTITGTIVGEDYIQTQSYDPTGNILSKSDQGNYSYSQSGKTNPQAVTSIDDGQGNSKSFAYDVNGNLIQEVQTYSGGTTVTKNIVWDELDRITSIEVTNEFGATTTMTFVYDHTGRRLSKTVTNQFGDETTLYPFADYEVTAEGKTKVSISGNSMHLATVETDTDDSSRVMFSHTDHLGGGNILTDASGGQVQTLDYYPFGSIRVDEEYQDFDETKKFTGHEFDDESGYYYAQARYYHSDIGRFVSGDPLQWRPGELMQKFQQQPQALNFYSYSMNNPIRVTDPTGENGIYWDNDFSLTTTKYWLKKGAESAYRFGEKSKEIVESFLINPVETTVSTLASETYVIKIIEKYHEGRDISLDMINILESETIEENMDAGIGLFENAIKMINPLPTPLEPDDIGIEKAHSNTPSLQSSSEGLHNQSIQTNNTNQTSPLNNGGEPTRYGPEIPDSIRAQRSKK